MNWSRLRNPVLARDEWSFKDACLARRDGLFHIFTSAFDQERSHVVSLTTPDFVEFSNFTMHLTGEMFGATGVCSPDIHEAEGRYVLTFNTWGQKPPLVNQLYCMESADLRQWSAPQQVAGNLTAGKRCIDLAVAWDGTRWLGAWKEEQVPRFAVADRLGGEWCFFTGHPPTAMHENFQFVNLDGAWHLLSTDYPPHHPWLYRLVDGVAPWGQGRRLLVPSERFNSFPATISVARSVHPCWDNRAAVHLVDGLDNAAALYDWRARDGHYYLLYAGKNEERAGEFTGTATRKPWPRGWNKLALARSRDLVHWYPAGKGES